MIPNFAGWIAVIGFAFLLIGGALVFLKARKPETYAKVIGAFQRKPTTNGQVPPQRMPAEPQLRPAPVAPITAVATPSTAVAPPVAEPTAPSMVSGTRIPIPPPPERTAMSFEFARRAPTEPTALQLLHNFKTAAALVQAFLDCPNEMVKYCLYYEEPLLHAVPFNQLGISAGWINACNYDGLLNGVSVHQCNVDSLGQTVSISGGAPVQVTATSPTVGWATADGRPPNFYVPLRRVSGSGTDIVANFLRQGLMSSYLRGLGLTEEAIAAAIG
jgi:hypothetical protein